MSINPAPDFSVRARRLMKEYKEIQKIQNCKSDPVFTVIFQNIFLWKPCIFTFDLTITGGTYK